MVAAGVLASAVFNKSGMLVSALDLMRAQQVGRTTTTPTTSARRHREKSASSRSTRSCTRNKRRATRSCANRTVLR